MLKDINYKDNSFLMVKTEATNAYFGYDLAVLENIG